VSAVDRKRALSLRTNRFAFAHSPITQTQVICLIRLFNLKRYLTDSTRADKVAGGMEVLIWVSLDHLQQGNEVIDV
jgi:hypothetical protein